MPVRNCASTVGDALKSLIDQTFEGWRLVAVDDGSDDGTVEVVRKVATEDERVTVTGVRGEAGIVAALNAGWRCLRCDLIARMDGDDICEPTRLEEQVRYLRAHPEIDVLGTAALLIDAHGNVVGICRRPHDHTRLCAGILRNVPFIHSSVMMRRHVLETLGGYRLGLDGLEDLDLWFRGHRIFRYANLSKPLVRYRVGSPPSLRRYLRGSVYRFRAGLELARPARGAWESVRCMLSGIAVATGLKDWFPGTRLD